MQSQYTPVQIARFWSKVDRNGPIPEHVSDLGPCWLWTGGLNNRGYGMFTSNGRRWLTHRWAYVQIIGLIEAGYELDHLCRRPQCCNPGHLEAVTHRENVMRGEAPTATNARKTHCVRGHDDWHVKPNGRRSCRECHRQEERRRKQSLPSPAKRVYVAEDRCRRGHDNWAILASGRRQCRDCGERGRGRPFAAGAAHPNARLTPEVVIAIRAAATAGSSLRQIAMEHALTVSNVHRIVRRETWAHVPEFAGGD